MHPSTTTVRGVDNFSDAPVMMAHYLCRSCGMSATIVVTPVGQQAWLDHVELHGPAAEYDTWAWEVHRLPVESV